MLFGSTLHPAKAIMQQPEYAKEQQYEYKKWVFEVLVEFPENVATWGIYFFRKYLLCCWDIWGILFSIPVFWI